MLYKKSRLHPKAPLNVTATPSATEVDLTWDTVTGATSYKVYRDGALVGSPTSNSYHDTGLTASTEYDYQVSAVNAVGEGPKSANITTTTTATE